MSGERCDDGGHGALRYDAFLAGGSRAGDDEAVPDDAPFDDVTPLDDVLPAWDADASAALDGPPGGPPPDWPPDVVPIVLWPVETLRTALSGAPGVQVARVVAEVTDLENGLLGDLSDDALGDLVMALGRLQSWSAGLQARVVAERAARETHPLAHSSLVGQVTSELVVTEPEAVEVVVRAESGTQHPTVIQALVAGRIDVRKAHTLLRSAAQLTVTERAEAIQRYLPLAPRRTWRWLRNKMLAFAKNRHGAAQTAKAETARRSVQVDRAENDMGWLSAYLPATDAAAVWGVIDDMAHQLRHTTGEDRTLGQLRADSLTGIITGRILPADRLTDTDTDTTGAAGSSSGDTNAAGLGTAASDATDVPVCTCGGKTPVQQIVVQQIVRPVRITPTRPVVRVTIPATALLGLDDAPGYLAGFGPIPAETARIIAQDATWQRLLTDPVTGILTDYSTTTYQPGKVLRAAIEARDETCTFGWCDTAASRCDLDHIRPFDHQHQNRSTGTGTGTGNAPGQTRAQNLHALCRKHHLLKTHAGWGVVRDPATGVTTWTTPTGRTQTRPPTVLDTHIEIDDIDPDTSHDLTLRALTGQRLPRAYTTTEPGTVPNQSTDSTHATAETQPDEPPF
ncbi:HNH endonuclease [Promicromonospora alba]|uniref:HNH endonuclease n=1 Tax=Promicromonospora alba TaxID=1616110 RepID=A0ABV9H951_9MICO